MNFGLLAATLLLLNCPAFAQSVGGGWALDYAVHRDFSDQRLGPAAGVGDLTGDGHDDFALASAVGFFNGRGQLLLHSGFDGSRFRVIDAPAGVGPFTSIAAAGDVDRDGIGDIVAGASSDSIVMVYSGATGVALLQFSGTTNHDLGDTVACAGDVDADGYADLICGAPYAPGYSNYGLVRVFSGATGAELFRFDGLVQESVGWAVCGLGDWNADGYDDFAYSAITTEVRSIDRAGVVLVRSGADGSLLHRYEGDSVFQRLGWDLDAADVNADGILDLVVADPFRDLPLLPDVGCVRVYEGGTGLLIRQLFGGARWDAFGYAVARAGNVDGDGHDDLIVGIPYADIHPVFSVGAMQIRSGKNGNVLHEIRGRSLEEHLGMYVASAGDVDADGFDHVLVSSIRPAAVYVGGRQSFLTTSADSVSISSGGRIEFDLHFPLETAGAVYQFLISVTGTGPTARFGIQVPLTPDPFFHRSSVGRYPAASTGFSGVLAADGRAGASLSVAPGVISPSLIGRQIWIAAVARDWNGAGLFSSVARSLRFVP